MASKMRIVANVPGKNVFIQKNIRGVWVQEIITVEEFAEMMKKDYPKDWEVYENSGMKREPDDFFYYYGCTEKMIRNGESYIFEG